MTYLSLSINERINIKSWYRDLDSKCVSIIDYAIWDIPFDYYAKERIQQPLF